MGIGRNKVKSTANTLLQSMNNSNLPVEHQIIVERYDAEQNVN